MRPSLVHRIRARLGRWPDDEPIQPREDLVRLGSGYGGWKVATSLLDEESVCYSAGLGDDGTFDVELIGHVGCGVTAFDPTPAGIVHGRRIEAAVPGFRLVPVALAGENGSRSFYPPTDPRMVSYSAEKLHGSSDPIEAECRTVRALAAELGHDRVDLLKLDIEGTEYEVIDSLFRDGIMPRTLCVEFHRRKDLDEPRRYVARLREAGYSVVSIKGLDFSFIREG